MGKRDDLASKLAPRPVRRRRPEALPNLTTMQRAILLTIEKKAKPKKGINKPWAKTPDIPVVQEIILDLLREGLVKSIKPGSKVVRLTDRGRAALATPA